jgi:hypothetical protein
LLSIAMQSTTMPKSKHSMLPFLVVLFLISYGLLALLVVEQNTTIAAQRSLIQQTMGDSLELTALKGKIYQQQHPGMHSRNQAPSAQGSSEDKGTVKSRKMMHPPKDTADTLDSRRIPVSI